MAKHDSEFKKAFWWLVGHDAEFLQRYHRQGFAARALPALSQFDAGIAEL